MSKQPCLQFDIEYFVDFLKDKKIVLIDGSNLTEGKSGGNYKNKFNDILSFCENECAIPIMIAKFNTVESFRTMIKYQGDDMYFFMLQFVKGQTDDSFLLQFAFKFYQKGNPVLIFSDDKYNIKCSPNKLPNDICKDFTMKTNGGEGIYHFSLCSEMVFRGMELVQTKQIPRREIRHLGKRFAQKHSQVRNRLSTIVSTSSTVVDPDPEVQKLLAKVATSLFKACNSPPLVEPTVALLPSMELTPLVEPTVPLLPSMELTPPSHKVVTISDETSIFTNICSFINSWF